MALKMEAIEMSLDDYIAMSKKGNNLGGVSDSKDINKVSSDCNDAKFGRRKGNIDDEEEDDEDFLINGDGEQDMNEDEVDTGIWKGPDASMDYIDCTDHQNDLRDKLNNSTRNQCTSVQYRLMAPNNSADRPRGIPTLLPLDAYVNKQNYNGYNRRRRGNRGNFRGGYRGYNNSFNSNYNNKSIHGNGVPGVHNGRIQRNRNQDFNKNLRHIFDRNDNLIEKSLPSSKNLIIERQSSAIDLQPCSQLGPSLQVPQRSDINKDMGLKNMPIGNLTAQAQAALNLSSHSNQAQKTNNNDLKSILGFESTVSGDMMPVFATRLLEFLQNGAQAPVHKPIYDMKIQKDIHEIQNKPLLYKCPGGEVVSSDGAGVDCEIIPRTSGLSLNCRFA